MIDDDAGVDPLALARIEVFTRDRLRENGENYPAPLRADLHLRNGQTEQVGFLSLDSLRVFVQEMHPRLIEFHVGKFEDAHVYEKSLIDGAEVRVLH